MDPVENGAQETEVEEPRSASEINLLRSEVVFQVEFDAYAEPKALLPEDLRVLLDKYGRFSSVSHLIGASEAFVRQNSINPRKRLKNRIRLNKK